MLTEDEIKQRLLIGLRSLFQFDASAERHFPAFMEIQGYDEFFDKAVSCPPESSPRTQARFKALRRHGNCRTRRAVIVRPEIYDEACDLTADDWDILLKPLLHNPNLEELYILACAPLDSPEVKDRIYSILGEVLQTSKTLKFMFLEMEGVYPINIARLAQGLHINGESNLEALIIIDRPEVGAMNYMSEMIQSAPNLRHLWLKKIGTLDDTEINEWSEALRRSKTLAKLTLEGMGIEEVTKLLTKAFSEPVRRPKQSVRELEFIKTGGTPGGWKQFFDYLRPDTNLTCLELSDCNFLDTDEIFGNLMDLLQVNVTLRKFGNDSIFSWKKDGKQAAINELLERNAKHAKQSIVA